MLTKYQKDALDVLIAHLDADDPAFRGDEQMRQALGRDARLYLQTWVLPLLDDLLNESLSKWTIADLAREAAHIRLKRSAAR